MHRSKLAVAITTALSLSPAMPVLAGTISFAEVPVPFTDFAKRQVVASGQASVDGRDVNIGYHTILRSGDTVGRGQKAGVFGQLIDHNGDDLLAEDGSKVISNDNDFSSLLTGDNGQLYMVSHFESRPGAMYVTELKQDKRTGELSAKRTRPLDFSEVNGGWVHCAGSVTPWGTHLGSEEYEPDAKQWTLESVDDYNAQMVAYFGANPSDDLNALALSDMNPYDYGYPVEVGVKNFNKATVAKHYAMGRVALELAYVMPDQRTAYMTDDGTNVGLFRFVADEAGDLGAGTLFVAKWNQNRPEGMGEADLEWINLGHATDEQVRGWIDAGYTFADIFDAVDPVGGACADGYTSINAGHEDGKHQCLKLKDVNQDGVIDATDEAIASRLETRRWAAMEGGTTEFRKMEGITFDPDRGRLYLAMSEIDRGMLDNTRVGKGGPGSYDKYDVGGPNHMTLAKGNVCGGVYAMDVDGNYTATNMYGLVAGTPLTTDYGADEQSSDYDGTNKCDLHGLANPDNVSYMPGYDTLIIGEDTGEGHQNDAIWAYNVESGALTRIETTPYGSETTSPYFYPNVNGHAYLMSVVQHPYGESDTTGSTNKYLQEAGDERAYTGYIGPFPAMDGDPGHDWKRGKGRR